MPGPLFTFAAYLGAEIHPPLTRSRFPPLRWWRFFFLDSSSSSPCVPFWNSLRQRPQVQSVLRGVNAAVVGVLIAAFIRPVCSSALHSAFDLAVAAAGVRALRALEASSVDHRGGGGIGFGHRICNLGRTPEGLRSKIRKRMYWPFPRPWRTLLCSGACRHAL